MDVSVESHAFAHAGDNSKSWQFHTGTHEQHQIFMASFTKCCNLQAEYTFASVQLFNTAQYKYNKI